MLKDQQPNNNMWVVTMTNRSKDVAQKCVVVKVYSTRALARRYCMQSNDVGTNTSLLYETVGPFKLDDWGEE
jgi:hypothetical protein